MKSARHASGKENSVFLQRIAELEEQLALQTSSRELAEKLALENSTVFHSLFESLAQGVICHNADGTITALNPAAERILGRKPEDFLNETALGTLPGSLREDGTPFAGLPQLARQVVETGQPSSNEVVKIYNPQEQRYHWLDLHATPSFRPGEQTAYQVLTIFNDITGPRQDEEALAKSKERLNGVIDAAMDAIISTDENLHIIVFNGAAERMFMCPASEAIGQLADRFILSRFNELQNKQMFEQSVHNQVEFQSGVVFAITGRRANGGEFPAEAAISSVETSAGKIYTAVLRDVSERELAEQELRQVNELFNQIVDNIEDIFWILDPISGKLLYVSPAFEAIVGLSYAEVERLPDGFLALILPEDRQIAVDAYRQEALGQKSEVQYRIRRQDGSLCWLRDKGTPIFDEQGQVARVVGVARDLTQQVEAQQALSVSEARFRMLADNMDEAFWITSIGDRSEIYLSPASEVIWGMPVKELMRPMAFLEHILPVDLPIVKAAVQKQEQAEKTAIEYRILWPDGSIHWVWDRSFPVFDESGHVAQTGGVTTDITSLKAAQLELEELNRSLEQRVRERTAEVQDLYDRAPNGYHSLDENGTFVMINQTELDWLGYTRDELVGVKKFTDLASPESREIFATSFKRFKSQGWIKDLELEMLRKDGSLLPVLLNATASYGADGKYQMSRTTLLDISELKKVQDALRVSEETYRALFENSNDGIFLMTPEREELDANPKGIAMFGYSKEEYLRLSNEQLITDEQVDDANERFAAVLRGEHIPPYERTLITKNGEKLQVEISLSPVRHSSGKIYMIQSVARDITERKLAEAELQAQRDFARQIMDALGQGLVVTDRDRLVEYVNPFMAKLVGRSQAELLGKTVNGYVLSEDLALVHDNFVHRQEGESSQYETRIQTADGEIRHMLVTSTPRWRDGQPIGNIAIFTDITQDKEIETNLRKSRDQLSRANVALEKAARMKDEFLASMSHELRTPLTGILGLSEALELGTYGELPERQLRTVKNIKSSGRHLLELINDILDLSKIEAGLLDMKLEPCSLDDICQASLKLIKGLASQKNQTVNYTVNLVSLVVNADERRLKQMLVNLLTNAIKFTPENGRLGLDVYGSAEDGLINLTVWDTGIGIKAEDMPRLFQPFVQLDSSLARMYSGTGLGLSLVLRMAELHGGGISVQSEPGKGSRFTIQLPWPPEPVEIPGSELGRGAGIPRVALIVEENPSDAEQLGKFLKMLGFATRVHSSGLDVLELAADERPGVILLDLNLSAKSGLRILAELQADERTNSIPVIITASMTSSVGYYVENRAQALALGAVDIMVKPVTLPVLRSELELAAAKLRAHEAELQDGSADNIPGNLTTNPLVLLAEDSEITRELMIDFLQSQHFRTLAASSGMELLNLVVENPPDIILMDIQMPDMDGLETMQRLRAHSDPRLATVPIIAVTALAMAGDRERCLEAGANEYMSKPISLTKLLDVIQSLLKTTRVR